MRKVLLILPLIGLGALGLAALPPAIAAETVIRMAPADMAWTDGPSLLPSGSRIAVLSGDPSKQAPFVFRLRFPAGYQIPAHTHSIPELVTVVSGTLNFGLGDRLDRGATQPLIAGAFVDIPAGVAHYAWTDTDVVIQVHGVGPFDIMYVDPASDPRAQRVSR